MICFHSWRKWNVVFEHKVAWAYEKQYIIVQKRDCILCGKAQLRKIKTNVSY